ncbi:META domain-containing protein [Altibacter sp. HG106]|uniref:META domain-containing protein n=1 Tax=Altibacter sp. HG106 TaxID=3023937 RepID=UPI002350C7EA|nr:META domain-containing protein [Altibacter sp. HG106]MDC7995144.1 META domain-containing protein [Altibacter sp. HG106]
MKNILLLLACTLLFVGCDETKKVIDAAGNVQLSGTYNITAINGRTVNNLGNPMNITFAPLDTSVRGNTGCNSFFGDYTLDLYSLSFADLAVTEKACGEGIMTEENAYLNALRDTGSYGLQEKVLTLYSKNDRSVLLQATKQSNSEQ